MSSFTKNGISVVPPVGSIMAYLGTTSPDGWILCNGMAVNNTDSKYQELINMGIGSESGTSYIPPNLNGYFLQQTPSGSTVGDTGGNSTATLSEANMPSHTHTVYIPDHTHGIDVNDHTHSINTYDPGHAHDVATTSSQASNGLYNGPAQVWGPWSGNNAVTLTAQTSYTNINVTATDAAVYAEAETVSLTPTVYSTGSGTAFDILPPYYNVNYILKY